MLLASLKNTKIKRECHCETKDFSCITKDLLHPLFHENKEQPSKSMQVNVFLLN